MRYLGVDLHTTNFVVCFLSEQGKVRVVTFSLNAEGLAAFRRQLRVDDSVAVEAGQTTYYFSNRKIPPYPLWRDRMGASMSSVPEREGA